MVAGHLDSDADLKSLGRVCRQIRETINHPTASIWRPRHAAKYDGACVMNSNDIQMEYKRFANMWKIHNSSVAAPMRDKYENYVLLLKGEHIQAFREVEARTILADHVPGAYRGVPHGGKSLNLAGMERIARSSLFMECIFDQEDCPFNPHESLENLRTIGAVQTALVHLPLDGYFEQPGRSFRLYQSLAYSRK